MNANTWRALDEAEQEALLHEADQVAAACAASDGSADAYSREELVRALAILGHEEDRLIELEVGDGEPHRRDF